MGGEHRPLRGWVLPAAGQRRQSTVSSQQSTVSVETDDCRLMTDD